VNTSSVGVVGYHGTFTRFRPWVRFPNGVLPFLFSFSPPSSHFLLFFHKTIPCISVLFRLICVYLLFFVVFVYGFSRSSRFSFFLFLSFSLSPSFFSVFYPTRYSRKLKEWILMHTTHNGKPTPNLTHHRGEKRRQHPTNNNINSTTEPVITNTLTKSTPNTPPKTTPDTFTTSTTTESTTSTSTATNVDSSPDPTILNAVPLKKRKLDELTIVSNSPPSLHQRPAPMTPYGIQFIAASSPLSTTPKNQKPPKSWLMEWCQKKKLTPVFTRESSAVTSSSSPFSANFVVTLHIPAPHNCTFTSSEPAHNARDAENSVCKIALHHLDKALYQQMEGPPSKVAKTSPDTPTKLTCLDEDPFTIPGGLIVDINQEEPQRSARFAVLPPKAVENPISFLKEVSLFLSLTSPQ
jgi:hypothetical protein